MNIHQIIPATERWTGIFYNCDEDSLIFRHVIAWGLMSKEDYEEMEDRFVSGFMLKDGDGEAGLESDFDQRETYGEIFLGYFSGDAKQDESSLLAQGSKLLKIRLRQDAEKELRGKLKRNPTEQEIDALMVEWGE